MKMGGGSMKSLALVCYTNGVILSFWDKKKIEKERKATFYVDCVFHYICNHFWRPLLVKWKVLFYFVVVFETKGSSHEYTVIWSELSSSLASVQVPVENLLLQIAEKYSMIAFSDFLTFASFIFLHVPWEQHTHTPRFSLSLPTFSSGTKQSTSSKALALLHNQTLSQTSFTPLEAK